MPSKKYIDKKICQNLGSDIWYDPESDTILAYDSDHKVYIEIDTDDKTNLE